MKKLLILLVVAFLLAGCGSKEQITCSSEEDFDGVKSTLIATADITDGKVSDLKIKMEFEDKDTAKEMCDMYDAINGLTTDEASKIKVTCNDNVLSFDDYRSFMEEDDKIIGLTKEEFISQMETDGVTCK